MRVDEVLLLMMLAPLGHDGAAPAHDAGEAFLGIGDVFEQNPGMDCEIVHTLLALLDEGVAEKLPSQILGLAVHFFQGLVDRHSPHRYRAVADNPFAGLVDVGSRGEVHQGVPAPAAAPDGFFHFFLDAGGGGRVPDIGVDFGQEVAADDHRLAFHMVDVGWDDGASGGNLAADEFRRDMGLDAGGFRVLVLADGHVFHLFGDDAFLGVVHLAQLMPFLGSPRLADMLETQVVQAFVVETLVPVFGGHARQFLGIAPAFDPGGTDILETLVEVDFLFRVGIDPAGVIDIDRVVGRMHPLAVHDLDGIDQVDFAHGHLDRENFSGHVYFLRTGEGSAGDDFFFGPAVGFFLCV